MPSIELDKDDCALVFKAKGGAVMHVRKVKDGEEVPDIFYLMSGMAMIANHQELCDKFMKEFDPLISKIAELQEKSQE